MTIDEAIEHAREKAEMHRNDIVPKENYHNIPWIDKNNEASMISAEEHDRDLTAKEQERFDKLEEQADELQSEIEDIENALDYLRDYADL